MTGNDYLISIKNELETKYNIKVKKIDNEIKFEYGTHKIHIYALKYALIQMEEGQERNHTIPIMMSSTDDFMIAHLKTNYFEKKGQMSIFDFI